MYIYIYIYIYICIYIFTYIHIPNPLLERTAPFNRVNPEPDPTGVGGVFVRREPGPTQTHDTNNTTDEG